MRSTSLLISTTAKTSTIWTTTLQTMLTWNIKLFGEMNSSRKRSGSSKRTHLTSDWSSKALSSCTSHSTSSLFSLCFWWQQWDSPSFQLDTCSSWSSGWLMELKFWSSVTSSRNKNLMSSKNPSLRSRTNSIKEIFPKRSKLKSSKSLKMVPNLMKPRYDDWLLFSRWQLRNLRA